MQVGSSSGPSGTSVSEAHAVFYFWVVIRAIAIVHSVLRVSLTILTNNSKEILRPDVGTFVGWFWFFEGALSA